MSSRLLATWAMMSLLAGTGLLAQDKAAVRGASAAHPRMKEALEAAKEDLPRAITILEKML